MQPRGWIDLLYTERSLPTQGYREIVQMGMGEDVEYLHTLAREVAQANFGRKVYLRALIEITNRCRNNCYYCGIRASNRDIERYTMSHHEILKCCRAGYELGLRTFVLQGGEDPSMSGEWIVELVEMIHAEFPECAITLSLGERSRELYERLFRAGADRYLLRHESRNESHYGLLHPASMSLEERLQALNDLKEIGYQTGTGIMVGSPNQSIDHIVEDIEFIEQLKPEMVGIGPFVPHHSTPFANFEAGSVEMTLRLISIFRLMNPRALIPSTTSLATLAADGRERGILAGANVVMPNISPVMQRANYALYDNKASFGAESAEGLELLRERFSAIGYEFSLERGDYNI